MVLRENKYLFGRIRDKESNNHNADMEWTTKCDSLLPGDSNLEAGHFYHRILQEFGE